MPYITLTRPSRSRRRWPIAVTLAFLLATAAACGDDDDGGTSAPSTEATEATEADAGTGGTAAPSTEEADDQAAEDDAGTAFPVSIEHDLGTTEVPAKPQRVVSVGLTEQDTLLALGVTPVAVTEWYGDHPHATWPWAQDELAGAQPEVLSTADGLQYEQIAALDPDLIVGLNAGLDEESYAKLSAIAPTIAHPAGAENYFSPWREQTLLIGRALGLQDEAQAVVDDIDEQFEAAAEANPEFAGARVVFLQNAFYDGEAIAYPEGVSTDFLTDLGLEVPAELDPFVPDVEGSQAFIPIEQLSVLDAADVLLWGTEGPEDRTALEAEPLYRSLEEVQDGRLVFTDGLTAGAIYFTSPLSLPFVVEQLVPALASALAGDGPVEISASS